MSTGAECRFIEREPRAQSDGTRMEYEYWFHQSRCSLMWWKNTGSTDPEIIEAVTQSKRLPETAPARNLKAGKWGERREFYIGRAKVVAWSEGGKYHLHAYDIFNHRTIVNVEYAAQVDTPFYGWVAEMLRAFQIKRKYL